MSNLKLARDFEGFNDHELLVAAESIKEVQAARKQEICNQFSSGELVGVAWRNEEGTINWSPARVLKINKATVQFIYLVDSEGNPTHKMNKKLLKSEQIKNGWMKSAMPSNWAMNS